MRKLIILLLFCQISFGQYNLFARQNFAYKVSNGTNTEIGGVSATISTAALLATKLGISVGAISNFTVVGSDIKCKITGSYAIPTGAFMGAGNGCTYYTDSDYLINTVNLTSFYDSSSFANNIVDFENAASIGGDAFGRCLATKYLLKNATSIGSSCFAMIAGTSVCDYYYIPNCTTLGTTTANNSVFLNIKKGAKIYAHPSLATNNGGAPDGDISAAATAGAVIRYVSSFVAPSAITTLAVGTIYNTAIQLNFTPPSSSNTIDFYECYANGVFKNNISASGGYISGLTEGASYNITVYARDIFYNKSLVSNSVTQATTSYSYTDADANAYISAASLTSSEKESAYKLIVDLKSNSLYTKMQAIYMFKGASAAQHKFNAKNPVDTDAAFRLTFTGTATFSNLGYQLNGASYANSYFIPSTYQNVNSNGITIVCGTNNAATSADAVDIGAYNSGSQCELITVKNNNSNYLRATRVNGAEVGQTGINESRGIFTGTKQSATVTKFIINAIQIATGNSGGSLPNVSCYIGALNLSGSPYGHSSQRIQMVLFHEGLSDYESATLHSIIDLSESIAGRKTW